ncbi:FUSC family protein [Agromyces indicus]|uniref:FUSC family protein n=1 Tax=Agromyces indicus TaxID=758919 RepID=A0ABU1FFR9_9MICO|nr:FUSC family protein [Agromyces indicus]MDR5690593.1 FUSC family protein [Agromyces indicus]
MPSRPSRYGEWRQAAREVWSEVIRIGPYAQNHWGALQVAISVSVPIVVLLALDRADLLPYAVFGSLSSVYGKRLAGRDRLRVQLGTSAILVLAVCLGVSAGAVPQQPLFAVLAMAFVSLLGLACAERFGWLPVPSLFLVFATGTVSSLPQSWSSLPVAFLASTIAALFGVVVGQAVLVAQRVSQVALIPVTTRGARFRSVEFLEKSFIYAGAPLLAGGLALTLELGHAYWAAVSATVPLVGASLTQHFGRAILRVAGTLVGVLIGYVLLMFSPPLWVLAAAVAVLQFLTEMFVERNYGIAVVCITPLALILSYISHPTAPDGLVLDRVLSTLVGIAVAVLLLVAARVFIRRFAGDDLSERAGED